jgi:hypothetical protein
MTGQPLSPVHRKTLLSITLLLIALLALSPLLTMAIEHSPMTYLDRHAETYIEETMTRAAVTFAVVRGLNGVVSVLQGTEIAVSPAGVGLNVSIGEILDPVNDLAERFSWVMLVSTASLGIQRILLEMGNWLGIQLLLATGLVLSAVSIWKRRWGGHDLRRTAIRMLWLAMAVRFFIPGIAVVSDSVYQRFLANHYREASQTLMRIHAELKTVDSAMTPLAEDQAPEGVLQEFRRWMAETHSLMNIRSQIERIRTQLEQFVADSIRLMVGFIFQTILIPVFMMWVLGRIAKSVLTSPSAPLLPPAAGSPA